jgi:hypothetical protein
MSCSQAWNIFGNGLEKEPMTTAKNDPTPGTFGRTMDKEGIELGK